MPGWRCFLAEPSPFCRRTLRRFVWSTGGNCKVTKHGYHNAEVVIDAQFQAPQESENHLDDLAYRDHPAWPTNCACGGAFVPEDPRQVNVDRLYHGSPDGKLYLVRELPVGAMWDAWWLKDATPDRYTGPDGKAWCVMMPCGIEWIVYGPSSDGHKWTVTGTPPNITANPSIHLVGLYHGHLVNGIISEDGSRTFPGLPRTA